MFSLSFHWVTFLFSMQYSICKNYINLAFFTGYLPYKSLEALWNQHERSSYFQWIMALTYGFQSIIQNFIFNHIQFILIKDYLLCSHRLFLPSTGIQSWIEYTSLFLGWLWTLVEKATHKQTKVSCSRPAKKDICHCYFHFSQRQPTLSAGWMIVPWHCLQDQLYLYFERYSKGY